jgi:hypothetical protein
MYDSMKRTTISSTMIDHHQKDNSRHESHQNFTSLGPRTLADILPQMPPPVPPHHHTHHSASTATRMQNVSHHDSKLLLLQYFK